MFDRLDRLGAIVECQTIDRARGQRERLVADYLTLAEKKIIVIVSQT